eukprot:COSAG04_NODE_4554_length_2020_cov_3.933889_2_plen_47_part_00
MLLEPEGSVCLSSSADFEDHQMEAYLDRMVREFRVIIDEGTVHFTE